MAGRSWPLALLLALTLTLGCTASTTAPATGDLSFLALGDSYTIGESVAPEERWVSHLARLLRERGLDVADPRVVARTGWTTTELATAMDGEVFDPPYDLVTLLVGVNDQYRGGDAPEYRPRFRSLLDESIELAGGEPSRVVVLSIPDWGKTPFAEGRDRAEIRRQLDAFNAVAREETTSAGARWVDITPIADRVTAEPGLIASDGLHPSGEQYRLWAEAAVDAAEQALGGGEAVRCIAGVVLGARDIVRPDPMTKATDLSDSRNRLLPFRTGRCPRRTAPPSPLRPPAPGPAPGS